MAYPRLHPGPWGAPLAPLFAAGVLARRWAYNHGLLAAARAPLRCVSVGGLEAGGSGKTPVVAFLLGAYLRAQRRVGLLTRGYGRESTALVVRQAGEATGPEAIGDEPAMLVSGGCDVPVAACGRRIDGARALAAAGCELAVLDDAFQHRALARNLDIVVLRGEAPFGNSHLLPWGTLREPPSSLARAHVVWLHFRGAPVTAAPEWMRRFCPQATLVVSGQAPDGPRDHEGHAVDLRGVPVVGAAGIARPADFANSLAALGASVTRFIPFSDHHRFAAADVTALCQQAADSAATAVVVTPKDAVKLSPLWHTVVARHPGAPLLVVLGTRVRLSAGEDRLASLLDLPVSALPT